MSYYIFMALFYACPKHDYYTRIELTLSRSTLKLRNFMARLSLSRNLLTNFA